MNATKLKLKALINVAYMQASMEEDRAIPGHIVKELMAFEDDLIEADEAGLLDGDIFTDFYDLHDAVDSLDVL